MQQRPDKTALLDALAQFLLTDLQPAIDDKRLAFRVLIAANLATIVSSELKSEEMRSSAELNRLRQLLSTDAGGDAAQMPMPRRLERLAELNGDLATRLRENRIPPQEMAAVRDHLRRTLEETLAVTNPRFDTSSTIE